VLSDHERKALHEIERQFLVEDPDLARSFRADERPAQRDQVRVAYTVAIIVAVVLGMVALMSGSVLGAVAFAALAGCAALARHRDGDEAAA
jgi:hypothetical protein